MTEKVIIVADEIIHQFLSGRYSTWNTQIPVTSVEELWTGLTEGKLSDESSIVIFSDQYHDPTNNEENLELAIATLCSEALVMVIAYTPSLKQVLLEKVRNIANREGLEEGDIYFIDPETPISDIDTAIEKYQATKAQNRHVQPVPVVAPVMPVHAAPVVATISENTKRETERNGIVITSTSSKGGSGKCLPLSTVIFDPYTGIPRTLEDFFADDNADTAFSFDGKEIIVAAVNDKISNGIKTTHSIVTSTGRTIRATSNHPFLTKEGWKELGELALGEEIAIPRSMPFPINPVHLSKQELRDISKKLIERKVTAKQIEQVYQLDKVQLTEVISSVWNVNGGFLHGEAGIDNIPSRVCAERLQSLLLRLALQGRIEYIEDDHWFLRIEPKHVNFETPVQEFKKVDDNIIVDNETHGSNHQEPVFWDAVVSIKYYGKEEVVDLEILETHNFVANDIIVHNSSTALLLASQIAQSSIKSVEAGITERPLDVCVVDMDVRDGQIGFLINKMTPTALNIRAEQDFGIPTIRKNLVFDSRLGISALLAPKRGRNADDTPPEFYGPIIKELRKMFDIVILDTSVNYLDRLIETVCLPEADAILFVTDLGISSVYGMVRWFAEVTSAKEDGGMGISKSKIGVVINKSIPGVGMDRERISNASQGAPLVGVIPLDSKAFFTASNRNRLDEMLRHPLIGPAYFKLAKKVIGNRYQLTPVIDPDQAEITQTPTQESRKNHKNAPHQQPVQQIGTVPPPAGVYPGYHTTSNAEPVKKKGLFGRK